MDFNEQARLQTFSQVSGLNPMQAPDLARSMEASFREQERDYQRYERSLTQRNKVNEQNARRVGENLTQLGAFSKTALGLGEDIYKMYGEAKEINETYDYYFGDVGENDPTTQQESEIIKEGDRQAVQTAQIAEQAEIKTGTPEASQQVRQRLGGLGNAVTGDRARAMEAGSLYPSWVQAYLTSSEMIMANGVEIPIREAATSSDAGLRSAALRQARMRYFEDMGLSGVSRQNVVKYVIPTMRTTEAQTISALASAGIRNDREGNRESLTAQGYNFGRDYDGTNPEGFQQNVNALADLFFTRDTGLTRREANKAAFDAIASGLVAQGNVEGLQALGRTAINPNAPAEGLNTYAGRFGSELSNFINQAEEAGEAQRTAIGDRIYTNLLRDLRNVTDPSARAQLIRQAATAMEENGLWNQSRELLEQQSLTTPSRSVLNDADVANQIRTGEISTQGQLDNLLAMGALTPEQYQERTSQLQGVLDTAPPKDSRLGQVGESYADAVVEQVAVSLGLSASETGWNDPQRRALISAGDFNIIETSIRNDMNRVVNEAIRANRGKPSAEVEQAVRRALTDWRNSQLGQGGKYDVSNVSTGADGLVTDDEGKTKTRFRNLINSPQLLTTSPPPNRESIPQNLTGRITLGDVANPALRDDFNALRGDNLFDADEAKAMAQRWNSSSSIDPALIRTARSFGMSPLTFLNSQLIANDLPPVTGKPSSGASSTNNLIRRGLTPTASSIVASQMSGFSPQELDGKIAQLERTNPGAYGVLTSEYSTPRQIKRAIQSLRETPSAVTLPTSTSSSATPFGGVLAMLRSGEGGYDSANRGYAGDTPGGVKGLERMTLGQWKGLQAQGYFALGAYQFIPETLAMAAREAGVGDSTVMSPEVQDRLAIQLMTGSKRPRLAAYLNGSSNNLDAALDDLALEWASVANASGTTAYAGVGGNAASISRGSARQQLQALRSQLVRS